MRLFKKTEIPSVHPYLTNKYTQWYFDIINHAKNRERPLLYLENHHIIPKSMGGSNLVENLVYLTAREHFTVHWILTKITSGNVKHKMLHALKLFSVSSKDQHRALTPLEYSITREARHLAKHSSESKLKISRAHSGKTLSEEHRMKYSLAKKGKPPNNKGKARSELAIEKSARSNQGKSWWNNGIIETKSKICPDCDYFPGRLKSSKMKFGRKYRWITNGAKNQRISVDSLIPEGWILGRCVNTTS